MSETTKERRKAERGPVDPELLAISKINRELARLDTPTRHRVLGYIVDRHGPRPPLTPARDA